MPPLLLPCLFCLLFCFFCLTEANLHPPRMVFTEKESAVKRFQLHEQNQLVWTLLEEPDAVISVGKTHLDFYNFRNTEKAPVRKEVVWEKCLHNHCNYSITVVHQREKGKPLFVCRTSSERTECCDMTLSEESLTCVPNDKIDNIREFVIKEGEHSTLVETEYGTDLYLTSGAQENVGIHKFGSKRVRPANHDKEQYYVGLVLSRRPEVLQNKVYAFYKEKNKDPGLGSDMWLPFVSQVCMADAGGPKNKLQFSWTSLMNARLYCGHPGSKQHFSELVDVATVHSDQWEHTKVYALFRNEWGISAVCIYTIGDIDKIFTNSPFIGSEADDYVDEQRKKCTSDSTKLSTDILRRIEKVSEMKKWVQPMNGSGPVFFKHLNYTRIHVDASHESQHTVMFLSLSNGAIHKTLQLGNHSFIIAEYQPFNHPAHILSVILDPPSRKLYVNTKTEMVQINVGNCDQYGNTCQDCVLCRDPYCGWKSNQCTSETSGTFQDVVSGNHTICSVDRASTLRLSAEGTRRSAGKKVVQATVPFQSSYFLRCPMSSHHAQYTWYSPEGSSSCNLREGKCVLLIDSMTSKQEGAYTCESEEMGYRKVLAEYQLWNSAAGWTFGPTVWVFVVAVLVKIVWF